MAIVATLWALGLKSLQELTIVISQNWLLILCTGFISIFSFLFHHAVMVPYFLSPFDHLPGPGKSSKHRWIPFIGNLVECLSEAPGVLHQRWMETYGPILRFRGIFDHDRILISDPAALNRVLNTHSYQYIKPPRLAKLLAKVMGPGIFIAEGDIHKRQRRMMTPAFGHRYLKEMVQTMLGPAKTLESQWRQKVVDAQVEGSSAGGGGVKIDVLQGLSCATLEVIGMAGFGYDFQSLTRPENTLNTAYNTLFHANSLVVQLFLVVPFYQYLPFRHVRELVTAVKAIHQSSADVVRQKREMIENEAKGGTALTDDQNRDLISILIRGNSQEHKIGEADDGQFTDAELCAQIMSFLTAGHETTAATLTWTLHLLSQHPEVQTKVRQELLSVVGRPNVLNYDSFATLPYLSAVIKEVLRLFPPIPTMSRVATEDDVLVGQHIPKGSQIVISPVALHRLRSIWGDDADEFKPERWMTAPSFASAVAAANTNTSVTGAPVVTTPLTMTPSLSASSSSSSLFPTPVSEKDAPALMPLTPPATPTRSVMFRTPSPTPRSSSPPPPMLSFGEGYLPEETKSVPAPKPRPATTTIPFGASATASMDTTRRPRPSVLSARFSSSSRYSFLQTDSLSEKVAHTYLPFMAGPRRCIGEKFALMELKVMLYHLLKDLEYSPAPGFVFKTTDRISLRPDPGMELVVKPVSGSVFEKQVEVLVKERLAQAEEQGSCCESETESVVCL